MMANFTELYNSAVGIVGQTFIDTEAEFFEEVDLLENNPDFDYVGVYQSTQDIDDEFLYQGFTLDEITKMSLNRYGRAIEVLAYENNYYVFYGQY